MTVIVRLCGGLGNQMFQYAAGRRLAYVRQVPMRLDLSYYIHQSEIAPNDTLRSYSLCHFNIKEQLTTAEDLKRLEYAWKSDLPAKFLHFIQKKLPNRLRSVYWHKWHGFDPAILDLGNNVYLYGYWQSWKYFVDIKDIIQKEFTLREPLHIENRSLVDEIKSETSVGIHVRRGDYVSNPIYNMVHGMCSLNYYHEAIKFILQNITNPHFFIFSDDPAWVEKNLVMDYPITIMNQNGVIRDYEDLYLMSLCQHFIIANSSFSWWAAWLSTNVNKIVVAPKKWFATEADPLDLIPENWQRI